MSVRIGIDFDNTLIGYDALFGRLARERGWLSGRAASSKDSVKKALIAEDGHDRRWQRLQADAYGARILEARAFPGALEFVARARRAGHEVWIVSHKSERSHLDPSVKLRDWARRWLDRSGARLPKDRVLFASTRDEKVRLIDRLDLDVFIDDLPEVLEHPRFPEKTGRILFKPALTWDGVARRVEALDLVGADAASAILKTLGRSVAAAQAVKSSGNNRLIKAVLEDGSSVLVKRYLVDARDGRPRARTEFEGLSLLWKSGVRDIPKPLALDPEGKFGIYSWLEGAPLKGKKPTDTQLRQAALFLKRLSRIRSGFKADAADSRSKLSDYAAHIQRRLSRVRTGALALGDKRALALVEKLVVPKAAAVIERLKQKAGTSYEKAQPRSDRWLSPSDFGFHNAVLAKDGRVKFLDFEYFGWDDPAKLVNDTAEHAAMSLSARQRAIFMKALGIPRKLGERLELTREPIALEWVLIILNVLSPEVLARRKFSNPTLDTKRLIKARLAEARKRLNRIPL
jgi:hypothetical protein